MNVATTPAQGLFLAVRGMNSAARKQVVRYAKLGWSDADTEEYNRLVEAAKKREQRHPSKAAVVLAEENQQQGHCPATSEANTGTMSLSWENCQRDKPSPSPLPSTPPLSTPPPTPSPARTREDADILTAARNTFPNHPEIVAAIPDWLAHCREHARERGKAFTVMTARAQLMELARMGPAKALRAIQTSAARGSASIIDPDEQRFGSTNGSFPTAKPRAEPDTTPLAVDVALFRDFINSPAFPEYRVLATRPFPKTEADMDKGVLPDWKTFKSQHARR